jgi:ABC-2 type transport system permease protein
MKRRKIRKQHIIELLLSLAIIFLLNYIGSFFYYRFDLTKEKKYSLSPLTKEVLDHLDDVVFIKIYLDGDLPAGFERLKIAIRELLDEFRWHSPGMVLYEFTDPSEDPDPAIRRRIITELYDLGLQPTNVQVRQKDGSTVQKIIFPGAVISYAGIDIAVNLLKNNQGLNAEINLNNSIQALEYEFISMIKNLDTDTIEKVAFIEGHGELDELQTGDITRELANYYQVDRGVIGGRYGSLDNYSAIVIAKPTMKFDENDKFVIDQYIMKGGKVLWLLDIIQVSLDSLINGSTFAFYLPLNLEDQLFRYGIRLNPNLVKDIQCHVIPVNKGLTGGQPDWQFVPWYYEPIISPRQDHPVTKSLNMIRLDFASVIDTVGENRNMTRTVLLATSPYSKVVQIPAQISLREAEIKPTEAEYNLSFQPVAILLEGNFESDFRNRQVPSGVKDKPVEILSESHDTKMIVVSDGDLIRNDVMPSSTGPVIAPLGYDKYTSQTFGNKNFILNAINYLTDEAGLINLRGREFQLRLLDRKKIQDEELKWKMINMIGPLLIIVFMGAAVSFYRRRLYG